jgi:hypothetical protein
MVTFHSLKYAAIQGLATKGAIVVGDLYYANDTQELYLACTDGSIAPLSSLILSGNIQGTPGGDGPTGAPGATGATGATGPQGPAGSGELAADSDVSLTTLADGEVLQWSAALGKWTNAAPTSGVSLSTAVALAIALG